MSSSASHPSLDVEGFAGALRRFRASRRMSQLDLALACDVSARHLSFLESGRARPSREMVLQLADGLVLPLGAQNKLLQAAGFSAHYPASPLESDALGPFRDILASMIARHAPNPALLCDRHWNILDANAPAQALLAALYPGSGEMNVIRMLAENPLAETAIGNLPEVIEEMTGRLQLEALEAGDDEVIHKLLGVLEEAGARYPTRSPAAPRRPLMPIILNAPGGALSFLSAIAHFGTSEDVTVRDLRLELLFPADDQTREAMEGMARIA